MAVKYTEILEELIRNSGAEGAVLVSIDGLAINKLTELENREKVSYFQ